MTRRILNPLQDLSKFASIVRKQNLRVAASCARLAVRARVMAGEDRRAERKYGIDTSGHKDLGGLSIDSGNAIHGFDYVPTPTRLFATFVDNLPSDLSDHVFIDLGSGKGRVLILASQHPFKEIIGVEFARQLHDLAVRNIASYASAHPTCPPMRAVHADAAAFRIPDSHCVLYFNNPFAENVMQAVLANVEQAHQQYQKQIIILYQQLKDELEKDGTENLAMLRAAPFLRERQVNCGSFVNRLILGSHTLSVYHNDVGQPAPA